MPGGGKKQTVGYKYYLGMHMALAHGPLDNINQIQVDRRVAWEGSAVGGDTIQVSAPELFGGDKREGGVSGPVDVEMGEPTQGVNAYLQTQLGTEIPAFRGVACAVLNQCYMGNNPYLKPWAFTAKRVTKTSLNEDQWYLAKAEISRDGTFTSELCFYACDSVLLAGAAYLDNFWPMDDPTYYSTVQSSFRKSELSAGLLGLEPSAGVGDDWTGTYYKRWTDADIGGTFELCQEQVGHRSPGANYTELTGYTAVLQENEAFQHIAIVTGTDASYLIDLNVRYARLTSGSVALNPRVTVQFDTSAKEITFTGSLDGSTPSTTISYTNDLPLHVITVEYQQPEIMAGTPAGYYKWRYTYNIYVDGEPAGTLVHDSNSYNGEGSTFVFDTILYWYAIRLGDASWLGLGIHQGALAHEIMWQSLRANFTDYAPDGTEALACLSDCPDMNPAHIIRECLTDTVWGMGYPAADIDSTSFTEAADTLHTEGMGISIVWEREGPIEDFVGEILRHIDAVVYVSRTTGKFVLKLIRDDGDSNALTLDETNVSVVSDAKRPTISELTNAVTVIYWDSDTDEDASYTIHNEALRQIQGVQIGATFQYPGFTNLAIAQRVAQRELKALSTPLLSCTVEANREAADLNVGDVFFLDWPDLNINATLMRVNEVDYGDGRNNAIKIQAIQDVFDTPTASVGGTPSEAWIDPTSTSPVRAVQRVVTEAPYYELVLELGQVETDARLADNADIGYLLTSGGRDAGELNADVYVDAGAGYVDSATIDFHPWCYVENINQTETSLTITASTDIDLVDTGTIAQIGDEMIRVDSLDQDSAGQYVGLTVGRGILDTTPQAHTGDSNGVAVKFWGEFGSTDEVEYVTGESVNVKLVTVKGSGQLAIGDAPADSMTFNRRAIRPYPPGNLQIDGESYPASKVWTADHDLTWAYRDRLAQTDGNLYDHTEGDITGDDFAGTTYRVEGYAYVGDSTVEEQFLYSDVGQTNHWGMGSNLSEVDSNMGFPPDGTRTVELRVIAQRDGYDSWQAATLTLQVPPYTDSVGVVDSVGVDSVGVDSTVDSSTDVDQFWSDVHALAKFEDAEGTQTPTDEASGTWSFSGTGSPQSEVTYDQAKFGSGSYLVNQTNASLQLTNPPTLGTNDWTIEFWAAPVQAHQANGRVFQTANGDVITGISLIVDATTENANLDLYASDNGSSWNLINGTEVLTSPTSDQFYHVAFMMKSGTLYCFVDGVMKTSTAYSGSFDQGSVFIWGGQSINTSRNAGYAFDEIRVTENQARYSTAGFTPPDQEFPTQ